MMLSHVSIAQLGVMCFTDFMSFRTTCMYPAERHGPYRRFGVNELLSHETSKPQEPQRIRRCSLVGSKKTQTKSLASRSPRPTQSREEHRRTWRLGTTWRRKIYCEDCTEGEPMEGNRCDLSTRHLASRGQAGILWKLSEASETPVESSVREEILFSK